MKLTITGIDERTSNINDFAKYPFVELAILYSETRAGKFPRYPSRTDCRDMVIWTTHAAIHICGGPARRALRAGELDGLVEFAGRIQINGVVPVAELRDSCERYHNKIIITQHSMRNADLLEYRSVYRNHAVLVDGSGGRGLLPVGWSKLDTLKAVGFAGGLNPENMEAELLKIQKVAGGGAWVDLETGVRTDDWFDGEKALAVCEIVKRFDEGREETG